MLFALLSLFMKWCHPEEAAVQGRMRPSNMAGLMHCMEAEDVTRRKREPLWRRWKAKGDDLSLEQGVGKLLRKGKMPLIVFTGFIHSTAGSIHTAALHPNTDNLISNLVSMHSYIAIHENIRFSGACSTRLHTFSRNVLEVNVEVSGCGSTKNFHSTHGMACVLKLVIIKKKRILALLHERQIHITAHAVIIT